MTTTPQAKKENRLVAVVNADEKQCRGTVAALEHFCDTTQHHGSLESIKSLSGKNPAVILVDQNVKYGNSVDFIGLLRKEEALKDVPIIHCINQRDEVLMKEGKAAGANDHLVRPVRRNYLIDKIAHHLSRHVEKEWESLNPVPQKALKQSVEIFNQIHDVFDKGEAMPFKTVESSCEPLVEAIQGNDFTPILEGVKSHDDYTYAHSMRVAAMLTLLGHAAGFKKEEQLLLATGGLLHDLGKMKIPHHILNKPDRLTYDEFELIKTHVPHTVEYLKTVDNIPKAIFIIAEQHHEKIDGTGYPNGLKGKQLNELARMSAVVDVFSALTDRRVYKPSMPAKIAIGIMAEDMKEHLDQHYVKMFKSILHDANLLN